MQRTEVDDPLDPEPTIRWAIHFGRQMTQRSLRQIAAISNISSGQISRLANGHSSRPSVETTVALAPALGVHPTCLLVLAGHLTGTAGQRAFGALLEQASDAIAAEYGSSYVEKLQEELAAVTDDESLRRLATTLVTVEAAEVDFPGALAPLTAGRLPDASLLDEIIRAWPQLSPDRRWRLAELTRDLRRISIADSADTNPK